MKQHLNVIWDIFQTQHASPKYPSYISAKFLRQDEVQCIHVESYIIRHTSNNKYSKFLHDCSFEITYKLEEKIWGSQKLWIGFYACS